jgi:hypothetical protein
MPSAQTDGQSLCPAGRHVRRPSRPPMRESHAPCVWKRGSKRLAGRPTGDPRAVRAQVHPPANGITPHGWRSDSRLRRGSFALGTGRTPMGMSHLSCVCVTGRPRAWRPPEDCRSDHGKCPHRSQCCATTRRLLCLHYQGYIWPIQLTGPGLCSPCPSPCQNRACISREQ